jgi:hypothetical protein
MATRAIRREIGAGAGRERRARIAEGRMGAVLARRADVAREVVDVVQGMQLVVGDGTVVE